MVRREVNTALARLTNYNTFYRIVLRDGSIRYEHAVSELEKDENSVFVKFAGMVQDVTEQKNWKKTSGFSKRITSYSSSKIPFAFG